MNRRDLLKLAALSAVPASVLQARSALAADAIELGCPVPMSGAFAANGKFADLGMKLAVEQYGKVLGRPLAYSVLDTEGKPATAVRKVQELAQQKNARYFAGGILSSESLAMGKEAEKFGASPLRAPMKLPARTATARPSAGRCPHTAPSSAPCAR